MEPTKKEEGITCYSLLELCTQGLIKGWASREAARGTEASLE
jgi:hypothetical protein